VQLLLLLNELSYTSVSARQDDVSAALDGFVRVLRSIRQQRSDVALVTEVRFLDLELPGGFSLRKWAGDGRNRDKMRYLMALRNRAPYSSAVADRRLNEVEHLHAGRACVGLGAAYLVDGLSISLRLGDAWNEPYLAVVQRALTEGDDGDITLTESAVSVRHAATEPHVTVHQDWLAESALVAVTSGSQLWDLRESLFPHLHFLDRVKDDLAGLDLAWLRPVRERLAELDKAVRSWNPKLVPAPAWFSKVTPESESRRKLCWFELPDGSTALFELHARFTPGAGRLHFRLDRENARIEIGYIGRKLGA
jgi:hypothetical protein